MQATLTSHKIDTFIWRDRLWEKITWKQESQTSKSEEQVTINPFLA